MDCVFSVFLIAKQLTRKSRAPTLFGLAFFFNSIITHSNGGAVDLIEEGLIDLEDQLPAPKGQKEFIKAQIEHVYKGKTA